MPIKVNNLEADTSTQAPAPVERSPEERVMALLNHEEPAEAPEAEAAPEAPPEQEAQPEQPSDPAELSPDDLPEEPQSAVEASFEIVVNGQKHTLTRDEVIAHARQGFDYTQKTQAVAEQARQLQTLLQRSQEIEQFQQQLAPELAAVAAFEQQLKAYQNVDWVRLATEEPLEYPQHQARYQQLLNGYNAAKQQFEGKSAAVQKARQQVTAEIVRQEMPKLLERIPEWRDPAKFDAGKQKLSAYLANEGYSADEINALTDSRMVATAWKAARYDDLVKAKADKVKQLRTAPPVAKPGAPTNQGQLKADKVRQAHANLKRSGSLDDAAAVLLNRWK